MPRRVDCSRRRSGSEAAREQEELRREIITKALLDETFRKKLFRNPKRVLGFSLTARDRRSLKKLEASLPLLEAQLAHLAGTVLCITNDL
ncbi:MAG: hypothetical protein JRH07_19630 [Deltaproteobacteria bacterium]|nr:hypothetical protein [Deltaproteobacteria bacterium]MBW2124036.1 hypothetical protein [Deltaproteobacteria bacterium]